MDDNLDGKAISVKISGIVTSKPKLKTGIKSIHQTQAILQKYSDIRVTKSEKKLKFDLNPSEYKAVVRWWQKPSIQYAMGVVRETLEKLMGSNLVSCMDRDYMLHLKVRIMEDVAYMMQRRIKEREVKEYQRMKYLVLNGKIPFENAPDEMSEHVVIILERLCNELIEKKRMCYKIPKPKIPTFLYWDDTPDPPYRLFIEKGHKFRTNEEPLCKPIEMFLPNPEDPDSERGYMMDPLEYKKIRFVNPMVQKLYQTEYLMPMYDEGDEIMKDECSAPEQPKTIEES